jgi:hypothetical protein
VYAARLARPKFGTREALIDRIVEARRKGQRFRVYVVLPLTVVLRSACSNLQQYRDNVHTAIFPFQGYIYIYIYICIQLYILLGKAGLRPALRPALWPAFGRPLARAWPAKHHAL